MSSFKSRRNALKLAFFCNNNVFDSQSVKLICRVGSISVIFFNNATSRSHSFKIF